ncbi:hypothetical protein BHE74_00050790, partial [Ensete ventricosum]
MKDPPSILEIEVIWAVDLVRRFMRVVGGDAVGRNVPTNRVRWRRGIFATAYERSCTCRRLWGENGNEK